MNKKSTQRPAKERLLISAERLFTEKGYNGVSVRDIAAGAKVTVGSIRYHFGSKEDLLKAVFERLVRPLSEQRRGRIEGVYKESRGQVLDVCKVLEAALEPVFRLSRENDTYRRLIGRSSTDPTAEVKKLMRELYQPDKTNVHKALRRACPHLPRTEFYWRYFCYYGATQYVLADVGRMQMIAGKKFDSSDPDVALKYVIPFLAAGMLAPSIEKKKPKKKAARSRRS